MSTDDDNRSLHDVQSSSQIVTANKPTSSFFPGRMSFLLPNQQCQSSEWIRYHIPLTCSPFYTCPGHYRLLGGLLSLVSALTSAPQYSNQLCQSVKSHRAIVCALLSPLSYHGFYPARVRKSLALKTLVSAAD